MLQIDIYIEERRGNRFIRVPWLPEKIDCESGGVTKATYDILDRGEVAVPTGSGLAAYKWKSIFPGVNRKNSPMQRGTWYKPTYYHEILMDWKQKGTPLRLRVIGYPINTDVLLDDYSFTPAGGFGDMEYEISFMEDRDIVIPEPNKVKTNTRQSSVGSTYTIKKGDTLWAISIKFYGTGTKWNTIYRANKDIIEKTARKYGKSSSDNGHWIYPGVKLTIP